MMSMLVGVEWHDAEEPQGIAWASAVVEPAALVFGEPDKPVVLPAPSYAEAWADSLRSGVGLMVASRMEASVPYWRERATQEGRTYCVDTGGVFHQGIHRLDVARGKLWRRISHLYAGPNYWRIERFVGGDGSDLWTGRTKTPEQAGAYGNVVVVSPESFGCPACEDLKGRLRAAGVAFHSVANDQAGPWPRLYADGREIEPNVGALQAVGLKTKSKSKAVIRSQAVAGAYSSAMMGMSYNSQMSTRIVERSGRRGPLRSLGALLFNRRGMRAMRGRSMMRTNYAAAGS